MEHSTVQVQQSDICADETIKNVKENGLACQQSSLSIKHNPRIISGLSFHSCFAVKKKLLSRRSDFLGVCTNSRVVQMSLERYCKKNEASFLLEKP